MRSGKLLATNDTYIEELINNPDYDIREDGSIYTLIQRTGRKSVKNNWRKLFIDVRDGYCSIHYKYKRLQLHRIIFRKFKGKLESDLVINHLDGNPSNNHPSNLELITHSENQFHAFEILKRKPNKRKDVLNFQIAEQIRKEKQDTNLSMQKLAEKYNTTKSNISYIINNKIWTSE